MQIIHLNSFLFSQGIAMTFEDVAVSFAEDEWTLLNEAQKALHLEVMEENLATLVSLGKLCGSPPPGWWDKTNA